MASPAHFRDFPSRDLGFVRGSACPAPCSRRRPASGETSRRGTQPARRNRRLQVHGSRRPEIERAPKYVREPIERSFSAAGHAPSFLGRRPKIRGEAEADGLGPDYVRIGRLRGSRWWGIRPFLTDIEIDLWEVMGHFPRTARIRSWSVIG